jgi:CRISPR-associated protein Cas1
MSALPSPFPILKTSALPDYLPARMVNEFVFCPRLFFYEWVDGLFQESVDTVEGSIEHKRVDSGSGALPDPGEGDGAPVKSRSVTLSSERLRVIAKLDLIDSEGGTAVPVDYKHGAPVKTPYGLEAWAPDRIQIAIQVLLLREAGFAVNEGVLFYRKTKQRVRVVVDEALERETERTIAAAWEVARSGVMPAPLEDAPQCAGCSLHSICLPDETAALAAQADDSGQLLLFGEGAAEAPRKPTRAVRRLMTPRDDLRPLYVNTQGLKIGKSGDVLQVREKEKVIQEVRLNETCQVNLMGNVQLTTQATQSLLEAEIPVCYFSMGGWFYGMAHGLNSKNVFLRRAQFRSADSTWFCLRLARTLIGGKIRNQRVMLQRNHVEPRAEVLGRMKRLAEDAGEAESVESLLGIEGTAARLYFGEFAGMVKVGEDAASPFSFDFEGRNRRPPRDPVNALLSLAYSLLAKDLTVAAYAVGFDPMLGFMHQPRFGRPALALDLMEPFRPLIADSVVLSAINTRMVTERDFVKAGGSVGLTPGGRKGLFLAYERRMDSLVTHPLFDYRVSYRRLLEIQARFLARVLEGEIGEYPVFVTR